MMKKKKTQQKKAKKKKKMKFTASLNTIRYLNKGILPQTGHHLNIRLVPLPHSS